MLNNTALEIQLGMECRPDDYFPNVLFDNTKPADCEGNYTGTVVFYGGCYWHKCPRCHPHDDVVDKIIYNRTSNRDKIFESNGVQSVSDVGV